MALLREIKTQIPHGHIVPGGNSLPTVQGIHNSHSSAMGWDKCVPKGWHSPIRAGQGHRAALLWCCPAGTRHSAQRAGIVGDSCKFPVLGIHMSLSQCVMEEMGPVSKVGKGKAGKGKHRSSSAELRRSSKQQNQCQAVRAQSRVRSAPGR